MTMAISPAQIHRKSASANRPRRPSGERPAMLALGELLVAANGPRISCRDLSTAHYLTFLEPEASRHLHALIRQQAQTQDYVSGSRLKRTRQASPGLTLSSMRSAR